MNQGLPLAALELFETTVGEYISSLEPQQSPRSQIVLKAMAYSLTAGGKRFRPAIGCALAELFGAHPKTVMPWLLAVEMIHTYSLIHDDLPSMDNDDIRRGKPTNHKVFGEAIALLAGDSLASEAFFVISTQFKDRPTLANELVTQLASAMGPIGMVKGQVIDLESKTTPLTKEEILDMHALKTGALIRVTLYGCGLILGLPKDKLHQIGELGELIGLGFQLKDDLLDSEAQLEPGSLPASIGLEQTQSLLDDCHRRATQLLTALGADQSSGLYQLINFNSARKL